ALIAFTLATSLPSAFAATSNGSYGGHGRGGSYGGGGGEVLEAIILRKGFRKPRRYKRTGECSCTVAVIKDAYGTTLSLGCNIRPRKTDYIVKYQCDPER
ncbi:MAG: hypothetical protein V3V04_04275, partial [Rhizobiaceae bacterium]